MEAEAESHPQFFQPLLCSGKKRGSDGAFSPCQARSVKACGACHLVHYCNETCQKADWPEHKHYCHSPMSKDAWKPAWEEEQRVPSFITSSMNLHVTQYGGSKYMWGNMPALNLLNLQSNEGKETSQGLRLLLAGTSGDPRNLIKTVAALPDGYSGKVDATLNDA
ncbi:hypothetical protein LOZ12_001631 [Ophidiomyces ophidiicola]|nr:hypothetical protein LOZ62_001864 [Ophidiomyces ophidiicola]KAI1965468.1 hypothetical protein LOZ59_001279 [Ophidiomyces ophidiicola]KAI2008166.1 hypothetical protein LOZ50_002164 [Ophidiomyces ophidiicola]KAI2027986.1 hypothetical protein LOZ45_002382 [Ophidiomyces ophidiicola]KAI2037468.1 hypothetical protein LOZ48_000423 [Ophidiomyces ophidiicola]